MTLMLASVADAAEAAIAARGGADIVDLESLSRGAVAPAVAAEAVRAVAGLARTSASLGAPPYDAPHLEARASALRDAGFDWLKLVVTRSALAGLAGLAREGALFGVVFADAAPDFELIPDMKALGFAGVWLDARKGRLLTHLDIAQLAAFCARCRASGLISGLAGALEPPDIPRLLLTEPDVLGFRIALGAGGERAAAVVRDLIPRERGVPARPKIGLGQDRIFVRDFVIAAEIGAYDFERGAKQRVAFDVEVGISRAETEPRDMRAIFSYDVILDAIRIVVAQGHQKFVEGLAEAVAALVLRHERAQTIAITVRKLDVIDGAVGVESFRTKAR